MSRGEDTRTKILEAAVELMGREGPDHFTASALAHEVGVSKATLFHHFASLGDIPLAALEEVLADAMTRLEDDRLPLREYLRGLGDEMEAIAYQERLNAAYFVFFVKGVFDPRLRERMKEIGFGLHQQVAGAFERRLIPDDDREAVARLTEVVLDGMALHHLLMGDHELLERAWRRFVDLVVEAEAPAKRVGPGPSAARPRRTTSSHAGPSSKPGKTKETS